LSAYQPTTAGRPKRWIQDRQNFVSIFHDRVGLIVGGGNTSFSRSGATSRSATLAAATVRRARPIQVHSAAGDRAHSSARRWNRPTAGTDAGLMATNAARSRQTHQRHNPEHPSRATAQSDAVAGHITLIPHMGKPFTCERGTQRTIGEEAFTLSGKDIGGWIEHAGWRLSLPRRRPSRGPCFRTTLRQGRLSPCSEGRIVVSLPFSQQKPEYTLKLEVMPRNRLTSGHNRLGGY